MGLCELFLGMPPPGRVPGERKGQHQRQDRWPVRLSRTVAAHGIRNRVLVDRFTPMRQFHAVPFESAPSSD